MKAVVFHGVGDIRIDDVPEPKIQAPTDAIVRLTASAICGTDLHFVRGSFSDVREGTILGHEGVGIVEQVGDMVRNFRKGDRVVICSTIACGSCSYCRAGYFAQCDNANPGGKRAGTAFFGGPQPAGGFDGLQAEKARVPFAHVGLVKVPEPVSDDQAILVSDIFPTGWFGADIAGIHEGHTVVVFGCGPVGLAAIVSARLMGAGRIIAVDHQADRLEMAQRQGAEIVNFDREDPVETIVALTGGIGADRVIDAVGVDAEHAHGAQEKGGGQRGAGGHAWAPGDAPTQVLEWAVGALAKAGTLSIIGVYPPTVTSFPIGQAMNKNLTIRMGNCNHRKYVPHLLDLVAAGVFDPVDVLTEVEPITDAIGAYAAFDERRPGWIKVELEPQAEPG
ncbi:zinc-dependent alcohol dehydrogenase [Coralloluteibacterium stylophorae]|uniref:Glutathione-dependent formaldehyde dehydrogenase n=1 Tax=Coralloluteibacterium stylophorae TaxID=1776034 RepID=A0A8J7VR85_9GAMM|nr:zinc-dependent alcohol dehydrogenase [Coralloluteibacterium stylophorae]MBS7456948.1 glutathione-dependent formaldehyde dehydrogenase [Coralloluteibacterium stylophorae]